MAVSFDRVASVYDVTRWAGVPAAVMEKILSSMKEAFKDCRMILERLNRNRTLCTILQR